MKTLQFLILALLATTMFAHAQTNTDPGRFQPNNPISILTPSTNVTDEGLIEPLSTSGSPGYAEAITPDIQALAAGLQNNPVKIFNYVHDHIRFVMYYGSEKGAELTLLEQSGNDFDQCALLVALLKAAGYSPGYGFGLMQMPYQATDGTSNDLQHWLKLDLSNNTWTNVIAYFGTLLGDRGYPVAMDIGDNNHIAFQRVWVTLTNGSTIYLLDPAFKVSQPLSTLAGFSLTNAIGAGSAISNALLSAAAGTDTANYVTNLNEAALRGTLTGYTTNLVNYLQNNFPNASVQDLLGGWQIVPGTNTALSQSLLFLTYTYNNNFPLQTWVNEPTNFMATFAVSFAGTNQTWYFPQLGGQGVALSFDGSGQANLWLGNSVLMISTNTGSGPSTTVDLAVTHPYGYWDSVNQVPVDNGWADQSVSKTDYQRTNANYALIYGYAPGLKWLNAQEQQLDIDRQLGYSNSSPQVVDATLNVMGMNWLAQTELAQELLCGQENLLSEQIHRIGRMAQVSGKGFYVDIDLQYDETLPASGIGTADVQKQHQVFDVSGYIWSALEHGTIEQMQNSNLVAASTVKMLEIANTNGEAIYLATSNNWSTIQGSLTNYTALTSTLDSLISQGYYLLLPQNGAIAVAGPGSYTGDGYVELQTGSFRIMKEIIGGNYDGGFVSLPSAVVNSSYTALTVVNQPTYFSVTPISTPAPTIADPVDTADGTFQTENTDLSLGQAEPHGITLSRYYNGTRRFNNPAGMAGGWIHNYCITANNIAAPQAGLGQTTPAQMAAMLVASYAALNLYNNGQPDPKNWLTTALIAKWGVDQLTKNGVSVSLGKDTVQFVQQPNGAFTPPANSTMTLLQTNSAYWLQQRHGNTFKFNAAGFLTNIVDQYGQPLSLTYNASNWVSTVTDWKGRTFTFNYSGTPWRLASVTDGTRTNSYGYSTIYNSQGDLTSSTDAEGKTSNYTYDTNHEITATLDALSRLVVSNVYDGDGHVAVQYTEGVTNKTWLIYWSGWETTEFDPVGDRQNYFYDDQNRLIAQQDALSNLTQTVYDGQNHVIQTVSPLNETNQFVYDGNNNLIQTIDPLGFTNQFIYDGNNNLIKTVDPLSNPTTFGYSSQFSLTGQTNGAGDWVNYVYTTSGSLAGTLASRTDSGGTANYGYDTTYGQLTSIAYTGLSTNNFVSSPFGDIQTSTDARGFATTFQYNNRRQLTNSIAPTNLVTKIAYDAIGNAASTTDPRGNVSSNIWSATRHLLATILPPIPSGTPIVTNIYDNRDWLTATADPLGNPTLYTNDPAGRLISLTDPALRTTSIGYDSDGRKLSSVNAANETNSQTWDTRGSLIQTTDGAGHTVLRVYDAAGNQVSLTNRNSNKWQFHFDAANRLTETITPLGYSNTVLFNHQGLPASITDQAAHLTSLYYDAKGRLTNRTDNVATTLYLYDANDNPASIIENSITNRWAFDAYNRVYRYRDVNGNLIQYQYDVGGNLTNLIYPGGHNVYYAFDSNNHLTNVTDWAGRKSSAAYDLDGRIKTITRPNGTYRTIAYDTAGEATNILEQNVEGFPIALFSYNWNNAAEAQWEFAAPLPHTNTLATRTMTYDADNRLHSVDGYNVSMDSNGNLLSGPLTNDTFAAYAYDARNRLVNVGGVTNSYDALNNRIGLTYGTNSTAFVVNPNTKLPQVLMRTKNGITTYYVYGPGLLYQVTETATATNMLTYHYDYRGSTIALTDGNGNVTDRMEYSLYATMAYHAGTNDTPFLFNGRFGVMTDPNGLLFMRARYYSPFLCRFINTDPSGFAGGLNFYAYANGNPVSYEDPLGLQVPSPANFVMGMANNNWPVVSDADWNSQFQAVNQQAGAIEISVGAGAAVGAAGAGVVGVGAVGLVAAGVPQSVVTGGLFVTGVAGITAGGYSVYNNPSPNNIAFNAGGLAGAVAVGGFLANNVASALSPSGYQPSGPASLASELSMVWRDNSGNPNPLSMLPAWLLPGAGVGPMSTGPSIGGAAGAIGGAGAGVAGGSSLWAGQSSVDWLGNPVSSSSTGKH